MKHQRLTHPTRQTSRCTGMKLGLVAAFASLALGCSPAPMPVSQSSKDPSSPTAPEGKTLVFAASVLPAASAPAASGHEHHPPVGGGASEAAPSTEDAHAGHMGRSGAGADEAVYVCPMHPEVTSAKSGEVCPKCNMKLVPKK